MCSMGLSCATRQAAAHPLHRPQALLWPPSGAGRASLRRWSPAACTRSCLSRGHPGEVCLLMGASSVLCCATLCDAVLLCCAVRRCAEMS